MCVARNEKPSKLLHPLRQVMQDYREALQKAHSTAVHDDSAADHFETDSSRKEIQMPLDGRILGTLASEQMEALERDFAGDEAISIGTVVTIVEIRRAQGPDADGNELVSSNIRLRHNTPDPFRVLGILDQAKHDILAN